VLLPVYTRALSPDDYGVIALLDIAINALSIVVAAGVGAAATRAHFSATTEAERDRVWWTALLLVSATAVVGLLPIFLARSVLARALFGAELNAGEYFLALALLTLLFNVVDTIFQAHIRARKASALFLKVSSGRLFLNIALNLWFLLAMKLGVAGLLWGNLVASVVALAVDAAVFARQRGPIAISAGLVQEFWSFGWPLIVTGLLSTLMHDGDKYLLRRFLDLHQVGLYSVAYQIGQGVNTLVLLPFSLIWSVLIYEIAEEPSARRTYARVFEYFVYGLSLLLLLVSIAARPLLRVLAPPDYEPAADLIPVICLGYLFFSAHGHFNVPALLSRRTVTLLPVYAAAVAANVSANLLLIPRFGPKGAAWATVVAFAVFAGAGLRQYRRIDVYPYDFRACVGAVVGMVVTYLVFRSILDLAAHEWVAYVIAATLWIGWVSLLFGKAANQLLPELGLVLRRIGKSTSSGDSQQA